MTEIIVSGGTTRDGIGLYYDSMYIYSGGTANNTTVNEGGWLYVFDQGLANSTTIKYAGGVIVFEGGVLNETVVNSDGFLYISSGGMANNTTVNSSGSLRVSSGGMANNTTVNSGCLFIEGLASNTTVNSCGDLRIFSGGTANNTTVNSGGVLRVFGGTASIVFNPWQGIIESSAGAVVTYLERDANVYFGSNGAFVSKANAISGKNLEPGISVIVYSGGMANSTTVNVSASLIVSSGGTAGIAFNPWQGTVDSCAGAAVTYLERDANVYIGNNTFGLISKTNTISGQNLEAGITAIVYSCGTANNTTVNLGGDLIVSSGGSASIAFNPWQGTVTSDGGATVTYLERDAKVYIGDNTSGLISKTNAISGQTLEAGISALVYSGGTANSTTVNYSGMFYVSGGVASSTKINYGGTLIVSSGGTANSTTIISGNLCVSSGGTANSTTVNAGGGLVVSSGGSANSTTVNFGDVTVSSGGTANSTTVNSRGTLIVSSGGTATDIAWTPCEGHVTISDGGYATFVSQYSGVYYGSGNKMLSHAAVMDDMTIGSNAEMNVMNGGIVNRITFTGDSWWGFYFNGGTLIVSSGGTANSTTATSGGSVCVSSGGTAINTTLDEQGTVIVYQGGLADSTTVNYGNVTVSSGGTANNTTIYNNGCTLRVLSGGVANTVNVNSGANVDVAGGSVTDVTVNRGATLLVSSGGTARIAFNPWQGTVSSAAGAEITYLERDELVYYGDNSFGLIYKTYALNGLVIEGGKGAFVYSAGTMDSTTVTAGGYLLVSEGGVITNTSVTGGNLYVSSGGKTTGTDVVSGTMVVGGTAELTTIDRGTVTVSGGGKMENTTVYANGKLAVSSGGVARDAKVYAGGSMTLAKGGTITGKMTFLAGAIFQVERGAVIDFDLTRATAGGRALLSDLSLVQGMPDYTITVDGNQSGVYKLADSAYDFTGTISVVDTFGATLGTLRTGETISVGGAEYTLNLDDEILTLTVSEGAPDTVAPTVTNITPNTLEPAESVTITAVFADDGILTQSLYRIGETGQWQAYDEGGVTVTENTTVYFKAVDAAGNESEIATYEVTNIAEHTEIISGLVLESESRFVESGQTYLNTTVCADANLTVLNGGIAENTTVYDEMCVMSGGTANSTTVNTDGSLVVFSGGTANNTTVNDNYLGMLVSSGGTATDTEVFDGCLHVYGGGIANNVIIDAKGDCIVHSGGTANGVVLAGDAGFEVWAGGIANDMIINGGTACLHAVYPGFGDDDQVGGRANNTVINSGGKLDVDGEGSFVDGIIVHSGGWLNVFDPGAVLTGRMTFENGAIITIGNGTRLDFDLTRSTAGTNALVKGLSMIQTSADFTLTVDGTQANGTYLLAENAEDFTGTISVVDTLGTSLGTLRTGETISVGGAEYTLNLEQSLLSVTVQWVKPPRPDKPFAPECDIDGNGVSDVMFQWTGGDQQVGFWMNGTSTWQGQARSRSDAWNVLGGYDMNADGRADMLMTGKDSFLDMTGTLIGYYDGAVDTDDNWHTVGFLVNTNDWENMVGNLTGNDGANSIVWYAPELYSLGAWTDGADNWTGISNKFGGDDWTLVGCGDFDGDGADSVVMAYKGGTTFYAVDLDGTSASLGNANWSGWEVRAIGDFAGDARDDMVLFNTEYGSLVLLEDGNADSFRSIGQLDAKDWFVVGCGDYDGDQQDDLLVRQYSTGMLGYYSSGDMAKWVELGRGVDMNWTVIA